MSKIVLNTLKNKLKLIISKRDKLYNEMQYNYYKDICEIRDNFRDILHRHGANSKEASDFAFKYADKEKELLEKAKYQSENSDKMLNKVLEYDDDIRELNNEIFYLETRK